MIVDELRTRRLGERVERSARLRWIGGEFRLTIAVPAGYEPPPDDATGFMLVALPLAMYRGEDLQVDGAVSSLALRNTERIQTVFASWDPAARRCRVRAIAHGAIRPAPAGHGCLFSRGVDSLYSATAPDAPPPTQLVYCDSLEPIQDEHVRARQRELVQAAAAVVGLPLLTVVTNLRDPRAQLIDYNDMHGAGIALIAHSLGGGLGRIRVPTGSTYAVLTPAGSHPLLDPLFSSESLAFDHHGVELGRPGKVAWLARHHPGLLAYLKVCFTENTEANCGQCRKCLWTMVCLQAAGALRQATLFPDEIDVDVVAALALPDLNTRLFWSQAAQSLGDAPADRRVRAAVHHALRRSARPTVTARALAARAWVKGERRHADPRWSVSASAQYRHETNFAVATLLKGAPYRYGIEAASPQRAPAWSIGALEPGWGPPLRPSHSHVGLLRLVDRRSRRHRYALGDVPPWPGAERVAELGALRREPSQDSVVAWVTADGRLRADGYEPPDSRPDPRVVARWVLAPAAWRGSATARARAAEALRRVAQATAALRGGARPAAPAARLPGAAHLARRRTDGARPLYSAIHPVTGDQLLSNDPGESSDLGYGAPVLLGYVEAAAPASGSLALARPPVPWASRFDAARSGQHGRL